MSDDNRTWRGDFTDADFETEAARLTRERDEALRHVDLLKEKIDAEKSCACSYDRPEHVCLVHSPLLVKACAENEQLRAEVERLRAENEALRQTAREYLETLGAAMKSGKFEMGGTAEMAHFVRQAMQRLDSLVFNREGPRPAGLERLHEPHGRAS